MRDLVMRYLSHDLTRRSFLRSMAAAGFTLTAADFVVMTFAPRLDSYLLAGC